MELSCIFGHKWNGCTCERCGEVRNEDAPRGHGIRPPLAHPCPQAGDHLGRHRQLDGLTRKGPWPRPACLSPRRDRRNH